MTATVERLLYTVDTLAEATGLSATTIRDCLANRSATYPALLGKRIKKDGSKISRLYITREQAEAWLAAFPDA